MRPPAAFLCRAMGAALLLFSLSAVSAAARTPGLRATAIDAPVQWLRVDPTAPTTLYVGVCGALIKRSTDGGATWTYAPNGIRYDGYSLSCGDSADPPVITADHALYIHYTLTTDAACRASIEGFVRSSDGGDTQTDLGGSDSTFTLAQPIITQHLYLITGSNGGDYQNQPTCSNQILALDTHGVWRKRGSLDASDSSPNPLSNDQVCFDMADDPQQPTVLYADTQPVRRSEDGGATWSAIALPTTNPPLKHFAVRYDVLAGALEGFTDDKGVPKDRVFLSGDHGRTWTTATCPGDHGGHCPVIVLTNTFGAGSKYAVFADGIFPFQGAAPAGARLSLSTGWPFTLAQVADLEGGVQPGSAVYALLKDGRLFASADAGKHWHFLVGAGAIPTDKPTSPPPGATIAGPYGHAVDARFLATYRKLGPYLLGYPMDESYQFGHGVVQDFEHLELIWHAGTVTVGDLGTEAKLKLECFPGDEYTNTLCNDGGTTPQGHGPSQYFPATKKRLSGDLLLFWRAHGGAAVLGIPISSVFTDGNGDGSKRTYQMQLFSKARLERHPENHNPRYAVLLGLLGGEVLQDRGWLPSPSSS